MANDSSSPLRCEQPAQAATGPFGAWGRLGGLHNRTILFRIGDWIFVTYGLLAGAAFFLAFATGLWYESMAGRDPEGRALLYTLLVLPAILLGARACSVLLEPRLLMRQPWQALLKPGYMLHGGVFGALGAFAAWSMATGESLISLLDPAAFALPLGEGVCRIGCFVYGCCWGKPTNGWTGVAYRSPHAKVVRCAPHLRGVPIHPTQLYAAAAHLALFAAFCLLLAYKSFDGMFVVLFCFTHPPLRFLIERFRHDDRGRLPGRLTHTQVYSLLLVLLGATVLLVSRGDAVNTPLDTSVPWTAALASPWAAGCLTAVTLIAMAAFGIHHRAVGSWVADPILTDQQARGGGAVPPAEAYVATSEIDTTVAPLETDVLIVGAGPYGSALAYDLHQRGINCLMVGQPFSLWRSHTLSATVLRSDINASQIFARDDRFSLRAYLRERFPPAEADRLARGRIPVEVFRGYTEWVESRLPVRAIPRLVVRLSQNDDGRFQAMLDDGRMIVARRVVLASGIESHRILPDCLRRLPADRVHHSWDVAAFERTAGQRLLVVGGGQSAAEIVVHLARSNHVTWVHRSKLIFFAEPINLPRPIFAAVLRASLLYSYLPTRLRKLLGSLFVASTITPDLKPALLDAGIPRRQIDAEDLRLVERGSEIFSSELDQAFDRVIACTGYRYGIRTLGYLDPDLQDRIELVAAGTPRLGHDFSTSVPNLYMVGGIAEPVHGPAQRFMIGCRQATLRVSNALAEGRA